jgi:chromosome segregation ATPase
MLTAPFGITAAFVALMLLLFLIDLITSFTRHHRDFRSIIVSVGVLGTFTGVFIGLLGFDAADIRGSVPRLLDGMKIAFLTSVVGMGLSVALSILYRFRSGTSDDEVNALNAINKKLDGLQHLHKLDKLAALDQVNEQIDAQLNATVSGIRDVRGDLHRSRSELDAHFKATQQTLNDALERISLSASEEIVKSLETVITDFNNNLTEQFGDNFKQLNAGIANLLEWQNQYRDTVSSNTRLLEQITESLNSSRTTLDSVATRNSETLEVYKNLGELIQVQKQQSQLLKAQMQEYSDLSERATAAFATLQNGFGNIQAGMKSQSDAVAALTNDISTQLPEALNELENTLTGLTNKFARDYQAFLERYRLLLVDEE